jgi:phosphohistidine swiveling domain-containing protein
MSKFSLLNHVINASYLNIEMIWVGMRSPLIKELLGENIPESFCEVQKGNTLKYFQNKNQANKFAKICAQAVTNDKKLLLKIKHQTESLTKKILDLAKNKYDFVKMSDKEMLVLLQKIYKLQTTISTWGMPIAFADINGDISNKIARVMSSRKNLTHSISLYLELLGSPNIPSLTEQAYRAISKSDNYNYLQQKYFWLDQGYVGLGLTKSQIRKIKKDYSLKKKTKELDKKSLMTELKLSFAEKNLFQVSATMVYLKALRADSRQALHVLVNKIIEQMAKRQKCKIDHLHMLSSSELMNFLAKKANLPSDLQDRGEHSVIIPINQFQYRVLAQANEVDKFLEKKINADKTTDKSISSFSGQIAQPGIVRGRVRLILDVSDNHKIKPKEILISISTSPQLLPAMKKASAFVTEMGGITSHAAIVSRELKKPCIVGVRSITSLLKDGDLIEVDANKGVIRIIKKK